MSEAPQKPRREVIKHSAAIQIENNITLLQRRAWNVLLYHAYEALLTVDEHQIRVRELMEVLEFGSKNDAYLKEALEALISCRVKWNVLDKDGVEEWGVTALLASAVIRKGVCFYAYSPPLRQRLYNPRMYARISLSLQNRFASKHAQALWELCTDYLGAGREHGETPFIPLERFRALVGVRADMFPQFKRLSDKVVRPALAEINRVSDLRVTVEQQRRSRQVAALKFKIRRVVMLPVSRQPDLFPELEDTPAVVTLLKDAGLSHRDAWEVWQEGFGYIAPGKRPANTGDNPDEALNDYVKEKIDLLRQRQQAGKVDNPAGFLLAAIRQNYGNAKLEQAKKDRAVKQQAQELGRLKEQRHQVTREMEDALHRVASHMIEAVPDLMGEAVDALRAEKHPLMSRYNARKSPQYNFRDSVGVAIAVGQWLEQRFPERFDEARKTYADKLAAMDARIGELEWQKRKAAAR